MTPARQEALVQGLNGVARKVFDCVPIAETWRPLQVMGEMRRLTGSTPDVQIVSGCLTKLVDAGLIKKCGRDGYQRYPTEQKLKSKEQMMTTPTPVQQPEQKAETLPLEMLGELAGEIVGMAENMKRLAKRVEDYALALEHGREATARSLEGYRQLKALLKGIQEGAE